VRPGDTLWRLAAGLLPEDADTGAVASLCARLYELNRAVIGDDPDLIRPGQRLRVPHDSATAHTEEEDR
jgi:nucleoid-associated protein YgaU